MKSTIVTILLVLAQQAATSPVETAPRHKHLYNLVKSPAGDQTLQLLVENYTGEVHTVQLDASSSKIVNQVYKNPSEIQTRDVIVWQSPQQRDVCAFFRECTGYLTNAAANAAVKTWVTTADTCGWMRDGITNYFTNNNYEQAKNLLTGSIASLAWVAPSAAIQCKFDAAVDVQLLSYAMLTFSDSLPDYLNMRFDAWTNQNDACGVSQPATVARDTGSQMYEFCRLLKEQAAGNLENRYVHEDVKDSSSSTPNGNIVIGKFFIDGTEFSTSAVCRDYGIVWKRDLLAAVQRGAERARPVM